MPSITELGVSAASLVLSTNLHMNKTAVTFVFSLWLFVVVVVVLFVCFKLFRSCRRHFTTRLLDYFLKPGSLDHFGAALKDL